MVPLRLDTGNACPVRAEASARPQLVLKDMTTDAPLRRRPRRSPLRHAESVLSLAALTAVLLYFLIGSAFSLVHTIRQNYFPSATPTLIMISKTVTPGMTLEKIARQYGDPSVYLLEREEQILRLNPWLRTSPLIPGQHLRIPVTNKVVIAQIQRHHNPRLASR